ncbi:alpha/beta fold hydrolase [Xylanimonas protaetiae]|uniref:Alpha/beta hydrolase n=1 Tax=Xylanimonas protaetiae TaxID=2509457 RepID=A0A4P6F3T5_9MICO|nr:alpha/beta hydrolase [Xylanimonas protaetiae]QAY70204.1 alpha/beta hydrolase [Xylanimonas protaetiae]
MALEPAVVFVHGMRTSSAIWAPQLAHVHDAGYDAVAVDLPAHGERRDERFTLAGAFAVIDQAIAALGADRQIALVGLSLGGYTTLAYAAREATLAQVGALPHPGRLAGVVAAACCSDPKGKPVALFRDVARVTVSGATAAERMGRSAASRWRRSITGRGTRAGGSDVAALLGATAAAGPYRPGWDVVTDALTHLAGRSSVADVRATRVPVWLVNGSRDHLRLEEQRHLAAAYQGALVVVPGAGHDVNSDAPDAFNRVLTRALHDFARH